MVMKKDLLFGMLVERNFGYKSVFISDEKIEHSRSFARHLISNRE